MTDSFLTTLGLCRKSGNLIRGMDQTAEELAKGSTDTVFVCSDISDSSLKAIEKTAQTYGAEMIRVKYTKAEIGRFTGSRPSAIFAVRDAGLKNLLIKKV